MKAFLTRHWHHIVFAVFLTIHALTCCFTTYFGDDYYYAAFVGNGADYMLSENIFHYTQTNGRALVHLIDELLLGWSIWSWRVFNVATLALLVLAAARIAARAWTDDFAQRRREYQLTLSAACGFFGVVNLTILRQSVYWATGSLNYLFPVTVTLWFYYLFRKAFEREKNAWYLVGLALIASATTEQASAASLLVVLCFLVSAFVVKRRLPKLTWWLTLPASLTGFATLLLAPGNSVRTTYYPDFYAMSIFGRIKRNLLPLTAEVFGTYGLFLVICALFVLILAGCFRHKSDRNPLPMLLGGVTALALGLYVWGIVSRHEMLAETWCILILILPLTAVMIWTVVRYFRDGEIDELFFVWCAVAVQTAMLVSPEFGPRTILISAVMLMVPVVRWIVKYRGRGLYMALAGLVFTLLPSYMVSAGGFVILLVLLVLASAGLAYLVRGKQAQIGGLALLCLCLAQFGSVTMGYRDNAAVHERNAAQVAAYKASDRSEPLVLYYLNNGWYKYTMPYDDPYHQGVLMLLCDLPSDTPVVYESMPE
ncbi:MAG: hypothetical protein IJ493_02745 [Clostridia bacterium]|nr:hypothetical protein [Clostridia bacterium]